MEPLSTAASVIALYQMASYIGGLCFRYTRGVHHAHQQAELVMDEISIFQGSLRRLQSMLDAEAGNDGGSKRLEVLESFINGHSSILVSCKADLTKMRIKLDEGAKKEGIKGLLQRLVWPFRESEVQRLLHNLRNAAVKIEEARSFDLTQLVLTIDSTNKEIHETIKRTESSFLSAEQGRLVTEAQHKRHEERKEIEDTRARILAWLKHANPDENHNLACKLRNATAKTGQWFIDGDDFAEFKRTPRSLLWLHGIAGCGKSILSSTIIEKVRILQQTNEKIALGYWYFSANEKAKISIEDFIRALLSQYLQAFSDKIPTVIKRCWDAKKKGTETPKVSDLISMLQNLMIDGKYTYYMFLDALDESSRETQMEVLALLQTLLTIPSVDIHILVTSRTQIKREVEKRFQSIGGFYDVLIEQRYVDADILAHIKERLQNDEDLNKWPEEPRLRIMNSLSGKAEGMFRWVDCQLQAIRKCRKVTSLHHVLTQLPKDLHEQYTRDLAKIPDEDAEDALKLLQWLTFPQRPLRLDEAVDLLAVDLKIDRPVFNSNERTMFPNQIPLMCGSLVRTDVTKAGYNHYGDEVEITTFTTSHTTVLDFLSSNPIRIGSQPEVRLTRASANLHMAETCLAYLRTIFRNTTSFDDETLAGYPAAQLCCEYWAHFYREIIKDPHESVQLARLNYMIIELLDSPDATLMWLQLSVKNVNKESANLKITREQLPSPIYYAAVLGLPEILKHYIGRGEDVNCTTGWGYGTPLVAASALGDDESVAILLTSGADPTLAGRCSVGCPLAVAVENNMLKVVDMLLNHGVVNINCHRYQKGTENTGKSDPEEEGDVAEEERQRKKTADRGDTEYKQEREEELPNIYIDDNIYDKDHKEPAVNDLSQEGMIYIAAAYDSPEALSLLLERHADANMEGGLYHTALQAACAGGREAIVKQLLDHGAKVDLYGGFWGTALIAACSGISNSGIVRRMIDAGSNVNYTDEWGKCPLYAACLREKIGIIQLLLESGASPNVTGCGDCSNPLQLACRLGNKTIVDILLRHRASFNIRGGLYDNCLQAACQGGKESIVLQLLKAGMSANVKGGPFTYPLVRAVAINQEKVVEALLLHGANPNLEVEDMPERRGTTAIQYAHTISMIDLLTSYGASIDHHSQGLMTPLSQAIWRGSEDIVERLLRNGASPSLSHLKYGSPLVVACRRGSIPIVELLVAHGADIDALEDVYGPTPALSVAAAWGHVDLVTFLIDRGADVHLVHWQGGTALMAACLQDDLKVIRLIYDEESTHSGTNLVGHNALLCAATRGSKVVEQLLSLDFDMMSPDRRGCNALHYAASHADTETIRLLIERGLHVDNVDGNGWSALHWAAVSKFESVAAIQTLLEMKADWTLRDMQGRSALDLAHAFDKKLVAAMLKSKEPRSDLLYRVDEGERYPSWGIQICDGCYTSRGDRHRCLTCADFDLCFRCILDKDIIHFKDHNFEMLRAIEDEDTEKAALNA